MSSSAWKALLVEALAAKGCASPSEWAARFPRIHCWFKYHADGFAACACCGVVRRADSRNKPCPGVVPIGLRGA